MNKHFLLRCQKNLIKEEQEIWIIRNYHRLTSQKQVKIKPASPRQTLCLALRRSNKKDPAQRATFHPAQQMDVEFLPQTRTQTCPQQKATTVDRDLEGIFLLFTLIQWLAGLVTPAHCHGIESHGNKIRQISDFSFPLFSNMTPKGRVPGVVVRNAGDNEEC